MAVRGALLRQELSESKFQKYQITHIKGTDFCDRLWRETLAKRHVMGSMDSGICIAIYGPLVMYANQLGTL